jgi:hypothetical protein
MLLKCFDSEKRQINDEITHVHVENFGKTTEEVKLCGSIQILLSTQTSACEETQVTDVYKTTNKIPGNNKMYNNETARLDVFVKRENKKRTTQAT